MTPAAVHIATPLVVPQEHAAVCPTAQVSGMLLGAGLGVPDEHERPRRAATPSPATLAIDARPPRDAPDSDILSPQISAESRPRRSVPIITSRLRAREAKEGVSGGQLHHTCVMRVWISRALAIDQSIEERTVFTTGSLFRQSG
jgi:hypothetical protein